MLLVEQCSALPQEGYGTGQETCLAGPTHVSGVFRDRCQVLVEMDQDTATYTTSSAEVII
jgi:hypothetical protein